MSNKLELNSMKFMPIGSEDDELIPLFPEDEGDMDDSEFPESLPLLPLRNTVLFPGVVIPISLGREKSIKVIKDAYKSSKVIGIVSQVDAENEDPAINELNEIGTIAQVI